MTLGVKENAQFRSSLLAYFDERARPLPWRESRDPYAVLVSEFMLQQTRVETVIPYFQRWMGRFPSIEVLSDASQEEVLKLWQGLGYYSRARNLHQAVREVRERYGGEVPRTPEELRTLPGVGPYTAGAVASIAFHEPAAAVDGNVRRVLARIMDVPAPSPKELEGWAEGLVDPERPGDFNQALMELGSRVCTPRAPSCGDCPVSGLCGALAAGTVEERPRRKVPKRTPTSREGVAVVVLSGGGAVPRLLFRRRPPTGLLAGMWEFPGVDLATDAHRAPDEALMAALVNLLGELPLPQGVDGDRSVRPVSEIRPVSEVQPMSARLQEVDHVFSHRKIRYIPMVFPLTAAVAGLAIPEGKKGAGVGWPTNTLIQEAPPEFRWLSVEAARATLPLPVAQVAILNQAEAWLEKGR